MQNFFSSEILQYWDILSEYINPFSVLIWGILGGITAFIATLVLMIYYRKKILVRRRHWTLKVLSYCYLVFLPLFIGFCAMQWSALHNCEKQIVKNIPKYLGETNQLFNTYIRAEVVKIVSEEILKSSGHELLDQAVGGAQNLAGGLLKTVGVSSGKSTSEGTAVTNALAAYVSSFLVETGFVRKYIVSEIKKKVGDVLLMDKKLTNEFFDIEINKILESGILNTVVEKHVRNIFGSFKLNVWLMFLLGMAIPVIEIIIANKLYKRKPENEETPV